MIELLRESGGQILLASILEWTIEFGSFLLKPVHYSLLCDIMLICLLRLTGNGGAALPVEEHSQSEDVYSRILKSPTQDALKQPSPSEGNVSDATGFEFWFASAIARFLKFSSSDRSHFL